MQLTIRTGGDTTRHDMTWHGTALHGTRNAMLCYLTLHRYLYSRTGHWRDSERQSKVLSRSSSGTKVQLLVTVEIFREGMLGSMSLIAATIPVSWNSIILPPSLISLHLWGDTVRAPSGKLSTSLSSSRKVNSFSHCHRPHIKVVLFWSEILSTGFFTSSSPSSASSEGVSGRELLLDRDLFEAIASDPAPKEDTDTDPEGVSPVFVL